MSELTVVVQVARPKEAVFEAFVDSYLVRCWAAAPPGCYRTDANGEPEVGEPFRIEFIDAKGDAFAQVGRVLEVIPGEGLVLEMGWEGGPMAGETTRATLRLHPVDGGTRVEVRQGPFTRPGALEAHRAYWEVSLGRLARVVQGEAVPCMEAMLDEAQGYSGPLGVAVYAVLAGLREAGAEEEAIAQVEELLYTHLPRLSEEFTDTLGALIRARVRD